MSNPVRILAALVLLVAVMQFSTITPASARGGAAANIMSSPGYQRALEESRKRYRQSYGEPYCARRPSIRARSGGIAAGITEPGGSLVHLRRNPSDRFEPRRNRPLRSARHPNACAD